MGEPRWLHQEQVGLGKGSYRALLRKVSTARLGTEFQWERKAACRGRADLPLPGGIVFVERRLFMGRLLGCRLTIHYLGPRDTCTGAAH